MLNNGRRQLPRILALAIALALSISSATTADATIWTVYENGSGDAPTIQAAFDSTANGDTIASHCGDYTGSEIVVFGGPHGGVRFIGQGGDPSCVRIRFEIVMYEYTTFFENLTFAYGSSVTIDFDEEPGTGGTGQFSELCVLIHQASGWHPTDLSPIVFFRTAFEVKADRSRDTTMAERLSTIASFRTITAAVVAALSTPGSII